MAGRPSGQHHSSTIWFSAERLGVETCPTRTATIDRAGWLADDAWPVYARGWRFGAIEERLCCRVNGQRLNSPAGFVLPSFGCYLFSALLV
jgi:hypothetical protein